MLFHYFLMQFMTSAPSTRGVIEIQAIKHVWYTPLQKSLQFDIFLIRTWEKKKRFKCLMGESGCYLYSIVVLSLKTVLSTDRKKNHESFPPCDESLSVWLWAKSSMGPHAWRWMVRWQTQSRFTQEDQEGSAYLKSCLWSSDRMYLCLSLFLFLSLKHTQKHIHKHIFGDANTNTLSKLMISALFLLK